MDTLEKEEMDVTGPGVPSLDADRIDDDTDAMLDAALDAAIQETEPAEEEIAEDSQEEESSTETEEPAQEPVADPATPEAQEQQQAAESQIEIDPEISAIEQPRNLSEKNQSNWRKLQETASTYKKQAQEAEALRQRLLEYEQKPPVPQDYEDLRRFRALFDIASDPDFQSRYDKPIVEAKTNIYSILKKHGASEDVIKSIEAKGGPDKVDQKWWLDNAISKLPLTDAERLKRSLVDVVDLTEKKIGEIQKSSMNVNEYYEQKNKQASEWFNSQQEESIKYIQSKISEEKADWAMRKEIPKNATPDQIKAIESHNKQVEQLEGFFMSSLFPQTAQERADIAAAAAMSHVLTNQLRTEQEARKRMETQLKALTEENTRLKGAGKVPRPNQGIAAATKSSSVVDRLKMSSSDAIDLGLEEAGA
jgi:hypothetical protein